MKLEELQSTVRAVHEESGLGSGLELLAEAVDDLITHLLTHESAGREPREEPLSTEDIGSELTRDLYNTRKTVIQLCKELDWAHSTIDQLMTAGRAYAGALEEASKVDTEISLDLINQREGFRRQLTAAQSRIKELEAAVDHWLAEAKQQRERAEKAEEELRVEVLSGDDQAAAITRLEAELTKLRTERAKGVPNLDNLVRYVVVDRGDGSYHGEEIFIGDVKVDHSHNPEWANAQVGKILCAIRAIWPTPQPPLSRDEAERMVKECDAKWEFVLTDSERAGFADLLLSVASRGVAEQHACETCKKRPASTRCDGCVVEEAKFCRVEHLQDAERHEVTVAIFEEYWHVHVNGEPLHMAFGDQQAAEQAATELRAALAKRAGGVDERAPKPSTFGAISAETIRARTKFPGNRLLTVALAEEVGELARAQLQGQSTERITAEAVQVCAVAVRIIEEGDASFADLTLEEMQP